MYAEKLNLCKYKIKSMDKIQKDILQELKNKSQVFGGALEEQNCTICGEFICYADWEEICGGGNFVCKICYNHLTEIDEHRDEEGYLLRDKSDSV